MTNKILAKLISVVFLIAPVIPVCVLVTSLTLPSIVFASEDEEDQTKKKAKAVFHTIRPKFEVNLKQTKGRIRFLQVEVKVMARSDKAIENVKELGPMIQDALILLFSSKSYSELRKVEERENLRQDALEAVQAILERETGEPGIENILFTRIVTD